MTEKPKPPDWVVEEPPVMVSWLKNREWTVQVMFYPADDEIHFVAPDVPYEAVEKARMQGWTFVKRPGKQDNRFWLVPRE